MPVAKTTARASPETTVVPAKTTLVLCSASSHPQGPASRTSGSDSPVTVALLTRTENASIKRQSAGAISPASKAITSPGTSSAAGLCSKTPLRKTRTWCGRSFSRADSAFSAR